MNYAVLNEDGSFSHEVFELTLVEWSENHYCCAAALTEEEAIQFRVVPITDNSPPTYDPKTHKCFKDGIEKINNLWQNKWVVTPLSQEELTTKIELSKVQALLKINSDDNRIYADVIGNKATEYTAAEIAAQEYKDAGYTGNVPELVQAWADAKLTWTARQATDDILSQAAAWRQAASLIRRYRLKAKEDVKRATTIEEVEAAMLIWNTFVKNIRTQLGVE